MKRNNISTRSYSASEAAVLARISLDKVRREIEHGVLPVMRSGTSRLRLAPSDLVYLGLLRRLDEEELTVARERRARLVRGLRKRFAAVRDARRSPHALFEASAAAWQDAVSSVLKIDWPALENDLGPRLTTYERGRSRVVEDRDILGGEPVFKGTRLAVRHIGGMRLRGERVEAICRDFPDLSPDDVHFAAMYAEAHPRVGRPRRAAA